MCTAPAAGSWYTLPMRIEPRRLGWVARLALLPFALTPAFTAAAHAQPDTLAWADSRPEDLVIKLVTFGPGDDIYNYFGHNGIVVQDNEDGSARLYNFGMFHFGMDMLPNYM